MAEMGGHGQEQEGSYQDYLGTLRGRREEEEK
jgi:hypothetical protein